MFLAEEIVLKSNIEFKIEELKEYLLSIADNEKNTDTSKIDNTVDKLFKLLDENQQRDILIDRVNRSIEVKIGKSKILMSDAIIIKNIVQRKIEVLTSLIGMCKSNSNSLFDIHNLMDNRDKLLIEHGILVNTLAANTWRIALGEKDVHKEALD